MTTVLVVDDDPALRVLMIRVLQRMGYTTDDATNGIEAEQNALRHNPDVILMDLMMPLQDGYETCANLRKQGYTGHIIVISALEDTNSRSKATQHGANDYLAKPVEFEVLRERLEAHTKVTA